MKKQQGETLGSAITERTKRRQIVEGAKEVFMTLGFDAASMEEIARRAGVSKGTLYVYFASKKDMFEAILEEHFRERDSQIFALSDSDENIEDALTRLGVAFVHYSLLRTNICFLRAVIGIADRMPEVSAKFYISGSASRARTLALYLHDRIRAGVLIAHDCEVGATQFLDSCGSTTVTPMLFGAAGTPSDQHVNRVVHMAVRGYLAAYKRTSGT